MLFHVTMKHSEDNCPAYHKEKMPGILEAFEKLEELGGELGVKQHSFVWCPPDHTAFLLLEADNLSAVSRYVFSIPMPQEINVTPVEPIQDTVAMVKEMLAKSS
ncbi:MAG: DUF3303 domain-containing protein [Planctomycetota bacterium]|jgi:hypothetical protein